MSADPLAIHVPGKADFNAYAYVSGQALKATDPLGLDEDTLTSDPTNLNDQKAAEEMLQAKGNVTSYAPGKSQARATPPPAPTVAKPPPKPEPDCTGDGTLCSVLIGAANVGIGAVAFVAGAGDMMLGDAPVWHDPDKPLAPIEAATSKRFDQWKLVPPDQEDAGNRLTYSLTTKLGAVAPAFGRGNTGVLLAEGEGAAKTAGALSSGGSRPLTPADLGLSENAVVEGTFSLKGSKATAKVDYLGAPREGLGSGLLGARKNLAAAARTEGATKLRIETSRVYEETGRLQQILLKAGFDVRSNGTMWWEGNL